MDPSSKGNFCLLVNTRVGLYSLACTDDGRVPFLVATVEWQHLSWIRIFAVGGPTLHEPTPISGVSLADEEGRGKAAYFVHSRFPATATYSLRRIQKLLFARSRTACFSAVLAELPRWYTAHAILRIYKRNSTSIGSSLSSRKITG